MTLSQVVTVEGWTDVALVLQRVGGVPGAVYVYSIVVVGSFYVVNLFLAVTWQTYMSQQAKKPNAVATVTPLMLDAAPAVKPARGASASRRGQANQAPGRSLSAAFSVGRAVPGRAVPSRASAWCARFAFMKRSLSGVFGACKIMRYAYRTE